MAPRTHQTKADRQLDRLVRRGRRIDELTQQADATIAELRRINRRRSRWAVARRRVLQERLAAIGAEARRLVGMKV